MSSPTPTNKAAIIGFAVLTAMSHLNQESILPKIDSTHVQSSVVQQSAHALMRLPASNLDAFAPQLPLRVVMDDSEIDVQLLAYRNCSSTTSTAASDCNYGSTSWSDNCYNNCYSNCHSNRGWR
jgi:hypothetical protein